ncbi:hypothetical protein HB162lentus_05730 [Mammaliicoccus lentus]
MKKACYKRIFIPSQLLPIQKESLGQLFMSQTLLRFKLIISSSNFIERLILTTNILF